MGCQPFSSEGSTPLPYGIIITIFLIKFLLTTNNVMSFSYLPKMVKWFGTPEADVGYRVGVLGASLNIGWILSYFFWGLIGDRYGRRRTLLVAIGGCMLTGLLFGFSTNFYWALCSRFLFGLNMGMTSVLKAVLVLACDQTNSSLAFSVYYSGWTMACLLGPSVASYLVFPVEQYHGAMKMNSIFGKFKVLLPNLIVSLIWICLFALALRFIPSDGSEMNEEGEGEELLADQIADQPGEVDEGCYENESIHDETLNSIAKMKAQPMGVWQNIVHLFSCKEFMSCTVLYSMISPIGMFLDEIFPVFAATQAQYNGLNLTTSQIGTVFLGAAGILLPLQYLIIPKLIKLMKGRGALVFASILQAICVLVIPLASGNRRIAMIAISICTMGVNYFMLNTSEISINILVNNCSPKSVLGVANSIAGTACLTGRIIGPLIYGALYSWSLQNVRGVDESKGNALGFPFDQHFVFIVVSLTSLVVAVGAKLMLLEDIEASDEK